MSEIPRTREELTAIASSHINRHNLPDCWRDVDDMVNEMMQAGAREERRKNEERREKPYAYMVVGKDGGRFLGFADALVGDPPEGAISLYLPEPAQEGPAQNASPTDTERMDWLEKHAGNTHLAVTWDGFGISRENCVVHRAPTIRQVVDAALAEEKAKA